MTEILTSVPSAAADYAFASRTRLADQILRWDVGRSGEILVEAGERFAWFRLADGCPNPLAAADDASLPLARLVGSGRDLNVLSYRPGRRIVLRRRSGGRVSIEKGYRKRRSAGAAQRHRVAYEALSDSTVTAPELLSRRPDRESIVLEHVEGRRPRLAADSAGTFRDLGAGLRVLQGCRATTCLTVFDVSDELAGLDAWRRRVARVGLAEPEGWARVRDSVARRAAGLPTSTVVPAHRDLHDGQLIVGERGLALLDFDLLCLADPALDAGNLLGHLELRSLQRPTGISQCDTDYLGVAFLEGLSRSGVGWQGRLCFYRATCLLRLALVYSVRPPWAHLAAELTRRAQRCLDG